LEREGCAPLQIRENLCLLEVFIIVFFIFAASDGDEIKYTNWSDDWNPLAGNCISINASNGKWKAIECSEKRKVVCQRGKHYQFICYYMYKLAGHILTCN